MAAAVQPYSSAEALAMSTNLDGDSFQQLKNNLTRDNRMGYKGYTPESDLDYSKGAKADIFDYEKTKAALQFENYASGGMMYLSGENFSEYARKVSAEMSATGEGGYGLAKVKVVASSAETSLRFIFSANYSLFFKIIRLSKFSGNPIDFGTGGKREL